MNTTHPGSENLIPLSQRTSEERREIAKKGGKCSGVARRKFKTQREIFKYIGGCRPEIDVEKVKKKFGIEDDIEMTNEVLGALKTFQKWIETGNPKYGEFVRDTKGEKPTETYEDLTPHSPILLGLVPQEKVDEYNDRKESRPDPLKLPKQQVNPEEVKK